MKFGIMAILLLLLLIGCKAVVQEYQKTEEVPRAVERIGPAVEKASPASQEAKPFELEMPKEKIPLPKRETFELTEKDLFAEKSWGPLKVSVLNITLGDSLDLVLSQLGKPDEAIAHPEKDIINIGYGPAIGIKNVGIVFFFTDKALNRITVKQDFNDYLHGKTVINYTKQQIYENFGVPSEQEDLPKFRVFKYPSQGLEILHTGGKMKAFVITYPKNIIAVSQGTSD